MAHPDREMEPCLDITASVRIGAPGWASETSAAGATIANINRQTFGMRLPAPLDRSGVLAGNVIGIELLIEATQ